MRDKEINMENIVEIVTDHEERLRTIDCELKLSNTVRAEVGLLDEQVRNLDRRMKTVEGKIDTLTNNTSSMNDTIRAMYRDVTDFIKDNVGAAVKIQEMINDQIDSLKKEFTGEVFSQGEATANKIIIRALVWITGTFITLAGLGVSIWALVIK